MVEHLKKYWRPDGISQFGEASILNEILRRIGDGNKLCFECGAWDGVHLSNVHHLWKEKGWRAILVEADEARANRPIAANDFDTLERVKLQHGRIVPGLYNLQHLDEMPHVVSLDIDGNEYHILEDFLSNTTLRPGVIIVEYNPTMPPNIRLVGKKDKPIGASLAAFVWLLRKDYMLVYATETNAFFVFRHHAPLFLPYDVCEVLHYGYLNFVMTDYAGRAIEYGQFHYGKTSEPLRISDFELIQEE